MGSCGYGLDDEHNAVPPGTYKVVIETNQERGTYAKQSTTIVCAESPASAKTSATANFEKVVIEYGPRQSSVG